MDARRFRQLAVFAAVARHGSFTTAARHMQLTKSAVSEHVGALERALGVRLLERTTRRLALTQVGQEVLQHAVRMLEAAEEIEGVADTQQSRPTGVLRISAPHDLGCRVVVPIAARLLAQHPGLQVELTCDDHIVNLVGTVDVALRIGPMEDSSLVTRKIAEDQEVILASPALVAGWTHARRPLDLEHAPWVAHALLPSSSFGLKGPQGQVETLAIRPRAQANSGDALRALIVEGVGFGLMPSHMVTQEVRSGRLVHVLPSWAHESVVIHALMPSGRLPPARVKVFLEMLKSSLVAPLAPVFG